MWTSVLSGMGIGAITVVAVGLLLWILVNTDDRPGPRLVRNLDSLNELVILALCLFSAFTPIWLSARWLTLEHIWVVIGGLAAILVALQWGSSRAFLAADHGEGWD